MNYAANRTTAVNLALAEFTDGVTEQEDLDLAHDVAEVIREFDCYDLYHVFVVNIDETYYLFTFRPDSRTMEVYWS